MYFELKNRLIIWLIKPLIWTTWRYCTKAGRPGCRGAYRHKFTGDNIYNTWRKYFTIYLIVLIWVLFQVVIYVLFFSGLIYLTGMISCFFMKKKKIENCFVILVQIKLWIFTKRISNSFINYLFMLNIYLSYVLEII